MVKPTNGNTSLLSNIATEFFDNAVEDAHLRVFLDDPRCTKCSH